MQIPLPAARYYPELRYGEPPQKIHALGRAGRRLAESRFSVEAAGVPFLAVYDSLLGRAGDLS